MSECKGKDQLRLLHGFESGFNANAVINWWLLNLFDKKNKSVTEMVKWKRKLKSNVTLSLMICSSLIFFIVWVSIDGIATDSNILSKNCNGSYFEKMADV